MTIRLKLSDERESEEQSKEEFKVNFNELEYLARDLSKIEPYSHPIIIFNFRSRNSLQSEILHFTTKAIWEKLFAEGKLPK